MGHGLTIVPMVLYIDLQQMVPKRGLAYEKSRKSLALIPKEVKGDNYDKDTCDRK